MDDQTVTAPQERAAIQTQVSVASNLSSNVGPGILQDPARTPRELGR
ncbi:MAG: hypothetical protein WBM48_14885 [Polyangiales bacterium]